MEGTRALESDAAVGLLSRSAAALLNVAFFVGVLGGGAFRALAKEAAVGAKSPEEGVLGRVEVGVFARVEGVGVVRLGRDGVLAGVVGVLFVMTGRLPVEDEPVN